MSFTALQLQGVWVSASTAVSAGYTAAQLQGTWVGHTNPGIVNPPGFQPLELQGVWVSHSVPDPIVPDEPKPPGGGKGTKYKKAILPGRSLEKATNKKHTDFTKLLLLFASIEDDA